MNTLNSLEILYEDNHLLVINKPSGLLSQGDQTGEKPLIEYSKDYIKKKYNKPGNVFLGLVHRLDRPTSGVIVFARTSKALSRLNEQFRVRKVSKVYWVLIKKDFDPPSNTLIHWMVRNPEKNKSKAYPKKVPSSKKAILHFTVKQKLKHYVLLEVRLETGRHHQIRAQMSALEAPLLGDVKYGAKRSNLRGEFGLHARSLELDHPITKKKILFKATPPKLGIWKAVLFD